MQEAGVLFVVKQNTDVLVGSTGRAGRRASAGAPQTAKESLLGEGGRVERAAKARTAPVLAAAGHGVRRGCHYRRRRVGLQSKRVRQQTALQGAPGLRRGAPVRPHWRGLAESLACRRLRRRPRAKVRPIARSGRDRSACPTLPYRDSGFAWRSVEQHPRCEAEKLPSAEFVRWPAGRRLRGQAPA